MEGFDLAAALGKLWKRPVRVKNDADMQGLGAARGKGVEVVITLGTGLGSAILVDGWLGPHLEIAQHPFRKGETYDQQLGDAALEQIGKKKWNRRSSAPSKRCARSPTSMPCTLAGATAATSGSSCPPTYAWSRTIAA